jgi:hypothetical protein
MDWQTANLTEGEEEARRTSIEAVSNKNTQSEKAWREQLYYD